VAVGVLSFVLLNYPLLSLVDLQRRVFGVPMLWAYLYLAWISMIILLVVIVRKVR
jgi:hypothetical protein